MLQPDDCLGEFTICRILEQGGMAEVYLARQERPKRAVALKVLSAEVEARNGATAAFHREGEALARIKHPGVVKILTSGITSSGRLYHALELIEGVNLRKLMAEAQRLDRDETATPTRTPTFPLPTRRIQAYRKNRQEFARQAGIAITGILAAVHDANVLHRDIKASNVMVDGKGLFYLLDFGISLLLDEEPASACRHGSSMSMSPECARGEIVDARSDIFSLGVLLYELVTGGKNPYDLDGSDSGVTLETVKAGKMRPLAEVVPDISKHLAFVIEKATQYQPRNRFQTAADMLAALRACDDPPTIPVEVALPAPASRWWVVSGASILLGLTTGLLGGQLLNTKVVEIPEARLVAQPAVPAAPAERSLPQPRPGPTLSFTKPATFDSWISLDGKYVVTASGSLNPRSQPIELTLWDTKTGKQVHSFAGHTGRVWTVGFSPDGKHVATGGGSVGKTGELKVWDIATGDRLLSLDTPGLSVRDLTYSRDGKFLAYCNQNFQTVVLSTEDGKEVWHRDWGEDVHSVAFSPDGLQLVNGAQPRLFLVGAPTGNLLTANPVFCACGQINSVAFRHDGRHILSGSGDYTVQIWAPPKGALLMTLKGHQREVQSVGYSPDGAYACSCSYFEVKLWDLEKGKEIWGEYFDPGKMKVHRVSFSADGKTLRACREDGSVLTWALYPN